MSVSGPSARVTMERVAEIAPIIQRAADRLSADVSGNGAPGSAG
jgi:DNA-binding IclR family transcriptional regulator